MVPRIVSALIVGIVVFLVALLLLSLLSLPQHPWAMLLGVLAGLSAYFADYRPLR